MSKAILGFDASSDDFDDTLPAVDEPAPFISYSMPHEIEATLDSMGVRKSARTQDEFFLAKFRVTKVHSGACNETGEDPEPIEEGQLVSYYVSLAESRPEWQVKKNHADLCMLMSAVTGRPLKEFTAAKGGGKAIMAAMDDSGAAYAGNALRVYGEEYLNKKKKTSYITKFEGL